MENYNESDFMNRFYMSDSEKKIAYTKLTKKRFSERHLKVEELNNGIILPAKGQAGGVCNENFEFVAGHFTEEPKAGKSDYSSFNMYKSYTVNANDITFIDETVVFGGIMRDHPGHMMLECIGSRLWWYIQNPDSKLRFAFVAMWDHGGLPFVREQLDLLGLPDERIVFIDKPTKFSKIIIPEQAIYVRDNFTKEFMSVINRIKQNVQPSKYTKIYMTRRKVRKQDIVNEEYFIDFYKKKGYKIIDPEDYTFREKVSFFRSAKEVVGLGATNVLYALFSDPDVKVFILGRANDPVAEFYVPYEAANIKDCYFIDACLNFLHKNRVWGVNLVGSTDYWRNFIKDYYNEEITETAETTLRKYSYDYLVRCAEYYAEPQYFKVFKNVDHFNIINLMNQVFLGRVLEKQKYNTRSTAEEQLNLNKNVLSFFESLSIDYNESRKFESFIQYLKNKKLSIIANRDAAGEFFVRVVEQNNINVVFKTTKFLAHLTDEEWSKCKASDVVVSCYVHSSVPIVHNGVKIIRITDILKGQTPTSDYNELVSYNALAETILAEIKTLKDSAEKQNTSLQTELKYLHTDNSKLTAELDKVNSANSNLTAELSKVNAANSTLTAELSKSTASNSKLSTDLGKLTSERKQLTESLTAANKRTETLSKERDALSKTVARLESETKRFESDLSNASAQNNQLTTALDEATSNLETANTQLELLNAEKDKLALTIQENDNIINELMDQLVEMEHSHSWRLTKPLRSIMWFFRRLFGKAEN